MSKELELFDRIIDNIPIMEMEEKPNYTLEDLSNDTNLIKQALLKAQEQEKVLKVIKKKTVSIFQLGCCKNVYEYNDLKFNDNEKLTQEEFNTLKEWQNERQ